MTHKPPLRSRFVLFQQPYFGQWFVFHQHCGYLSVIHRPREFFPALSRSPPLGFATNACPSLCNVYHKCTIAQFPPRRRYKNSLPTFARFFDSFLIIWTSCLGKYLKNTTFAPDHWPRHLDPSNHPPLVFSQFLALVCPYPTTCRGLNIPNCHIFPNLSFLPRPIGERFTADPLQINLLGFIPANRILWFLIPPCWSTLSPHLRKFCRQPWRSPLCPENRFFFWSVRTRVPRNFFLRYDFWRNK